MDSPCLLDDGRSVSRILIEGYMEAKLPISFLIPPRSCRRLGDKPFIVPKTLQLEIEGYTIGKPLSAPLYLHETRIQKKGKFNYYKIVVSKDSIDIWGEKEEDHFTAIQTLKVMLSLSETNQLPSMEIEDWADIEKRGVMIDISRDRVISLTSLQALIDGYSLVRVNQLLLYIEHTFAYEGHEVLHEGASPYTKEDILLLDRYCMQRGIELIINQNSFGHMERFLKHDQYRHLGENPDGFVDPWGYFRAVDTTISPTSPGVIPLFRDLYSQIAPLTHSQYFHVGGDEPWGFGEGKSKAVCDEKGVENVYLEYIKQLHSIVTSLDKKMMIWADFVLKYPSVLSKLPEDITLFQWGYEENHPIFEECSLLEKIGRPFYVCCGTSAWNSISGRWYNAIGHISKGIIAANQTHAKGFMVTEWGDNGHIQQFPIQLPPTIFALCGAWNMRTLEGVSLSSTLTNIFYLTPTLVSDGRTYSYSTYALLAKELCDLEKIGELYDKPLHNTTLLGALLTYHLYPYYQRDVKEAKGYTFSREKIAINEIENFLLTALSNSDSYLKDEILFTLELLQFLISYGEALLSTEDVRIDQIEIVERKKLATDLTKLVLQYSYLWKRRSRQGGLEDSLSIFRSLISKLSDEPIQEE